MKTTLYTTYFTLPGLLPEQDDLALNSQLLTITHFTYHRGRPIILAEQRFNPVELRLVRTILYAYPRYCPTEALLASYENRTDEFSIQNFRRKIKQALREGSYLLYLQPLKVILASVRKKLQNLDLDLYCLMETGYLLRKHSQTANERHC